MARYNVNERIPGGSEEPRLCMDIADNRLNAKIGSRQIRPFRETSTGAVPEAGNAQRRAVIGLHSRFDNKG